MSRKAYKNLFDYLPKYNEEEIKWAITQLSERDQRIVYTRDGQDLLTPTPENLESKDKSYYYTSIVPKLRSILSKEKIRLKNPIKIAPTIEKTATTIKLKNNAITMLKGPSEEIKKRNLENRTILQVTKKIKPLNMVNDEDRISILNYIKTDVFKELLKDLTNEQAIVICLKNGYIDGKYFSNDAIANLLNLDPEDVIELEKQALLSYKKDLIQTDDIQKQKIRS